MTRTLTPRTLLAATDPVGLLLKQGWEYGQACGYVGGQAAAQSKHVRAPAQMPDAQGNDPYAVGFRLGVTDGIRPLHPKRPGRHIRVARSKNRR